MSYNDRSWRPSGAIDCCCESCEAEFDIILHGQFRGETGVDNWHISLPISRHLVIQWRHLTTSRIEASAKSTWI